MMIEIASGRQRIACLKEETAEWLHLPGQEARTFGHTVRPCRAHDPGPKANAFFEWSRADD